MCYSYENLQPLFSITHDSYGGYRLLYQGKRLVYPPFVFRKVPVGFVAKVPEGVVTDLSIMSSERTGEQLLLLGPIRFVNSDCDPNCEYDFSSDAGIVQLKVKKRISPGDEIFVKYGPEFFENNACECRTCRLAKLQELKEEKAFEILLEELITDVANEFLESCEVENTEMRSPVLKKRRIRGRELVEFMNEMASSPLSVTHSSSSYVSPISLDEESPRTSDSSYTWVEASTPERETNFESDASANFQEHLMRSDEGDEDAELEREIMLAVTESDSPRSSSFHRQLKKRCFIRYHLQKMTAYACMKVARPQLMMPLLS